MTYKIYVRVLSATNLVAADLDGRIQPFVGMRLEGGRSWKARTDVAESALNPTWNEVVELDGYFVGSDVLVIAVLLPDPSSNGGRLHSGDYLGLASLNIRGLPLGTTIERAVSLWKCDKKGKIDGGLAGAGGVLKLELSLQKPGGLPWSESPWTARLYNAHLKLLELKPAADGDSAVYLKSKLSLSLNKQKIITKTHTALNPEWKESRRFLIGDYEHEALVLTLFESRAGGPDRKRAKGLIQLTQAPPGGPPVELGVRLGPVNRDEVGAVLRVCLEIRAVKPAVPVKPAPAIAASHDDCEFAWNTYSSSYGTEFTDYSHCSEKLSSLHSDERREHEHEELRIDAPPPPKKVIAWQKLTGVLIGGSGLPNTLGDELLSYVTVELVGKSASKHRKMTTPVVRGTDPAYGSEFDLGDVRKGWALEFIVWQTREESAGQEIAYARVEVKNIEFDNPETIQVQLENPPEITGCAGAITNWGSLSVHFNLQAA